MEGLAQRNALASRWEAGPAVRAAGVSTTTSLTAQQTTEVYAALVRGLPVGALAVVDLPAAVRTLVDLNSDLSFSRYEISVGLPRIISAPFWHEQLPEQLWSPSPCGCAPPPDRGAASTRRTRDRAHG